MVSLYRVILILAVLCPGVRGAALADCAGHDLFPALKQQAPAVYAAIEKAASAMPFRHGKLFRLSREGAEPSYIFATLHLSDPRVTELSDHVRAALAQSKLVVLESIETGDALRRAIAKDHTAWRRATMASKNERADSLLNKQDFAQLEALVASNGFPKSAAREFKPSTLALLLDLPECAAHAATAAPYLDELIARLAREQGIKTDGLERMIEQVEAIDDLPRGVDRGLLIAILRQADHGEDILETMIARYVEGDSGSYLAWLRSCEPIPGVPQARMPRVFLNRLITMRNYRMRDRALPLLRRGGVFIAVGAAHLPGRDGLLSLFAQAGYKIETVE